MGQYPKYKKFIKKGFSFSLDNKKQTLNKTFLSPSQGNNKHWAFFLSNFCDVANQTGKIIHKKI